MNIYFVFLDAILDLEISKKQSWETKFNKWITLLVYFPRNEFQLKIEKGFREDQPME